MTANANEIPPVYVVSLASAERRRQFMRAQLDGPFVRDWRFVDALPKTEIDAAWIAAREDGRTYGSGRLSASEHACLASHLAALRAFLEDGRELAIILEDDATLGEFFPEILGALAQQIDPGSQAVIVLNRMPLYLRFGRRRILRGSYLCRGYAGHGAQGYLVTRPAAERLLAAHERVLINPDDWPYLMTNHALDVRCVVPYVVAHGLIGRSSQLVHRNERLPRRRGWARVQGWLAPKWRDKHIKQWLLGVRRQPHLF